MPVNNESNTLSPFGTVPGFDGVLPLICFEDPLSPAFVSFAGFRTSSEFAILLSARHEDI